MLLSPRRTIAIRRLRPAWLGAMPLAMAVFAALPAPVLAHRLTGTVETPLPLVAYLAGAAVAVALSFVIVVLSEPAAEAAAAPRSERVVTVPAAVPMLLRAAGLIAWVWIVIQAAVGGNSDADVASLFLWVYGWIGVAIVSALVGPVWRWIDPFTTIHDLLVAAGRRLGLARPEPDGGRRREPARYPRALSAWPAVAGFAVFVWLELVMEVLGGPLLGLVLVGYTVVTVAAMGQFGRDAWRRNGETFSVWFGLLGRIAPLAADDRDERRLRVRGFGGGLVEGPWSTSLLVLVVVAAGSIIYDGLSQTQGFVSLFGIPSPALGTALLAGALGVLAIAMLGVARAVGIPALTAGLIPVAAGYLVAHYLSTLLVDGQRIVVALSDPLQQGSDLFGTAFHEPVLFLPPTIVWSIQLAAVVGGHIAGAWAGHGVARRDGRGGRLAQLPLAIAMVALTTATLWSLGQNLVFDDPNASDRVGAVRSLDAGGV